MFRLGNIVICKFHNYVFSIFGVVVVVHSHTAIAKSWLQFSNSYARPVGFRFAYVTQLLCSLTLLHGFSSSTRHSCVFTFSTWVCKHKFKVDPEHLLMTMGLKLEYMSKSSSCLRKHLVLDKRWTDWALGKVPVRYISKFASLWLHIAVAGRVVCNLHRVWAITTIAGSWMVKTPYGLRKYSNSGKLRTRLVNE